MKVNIGGLNWNLEQNLFKIRKYAYMIYQKLFSQICHLDFSKWFIKVVIYVLLIVVFGIFALITQNPEKIFRSYS